MVTVPGRILDAPSVNLRASSGLSAPIRPNSGSWNMAGKKFSESVNLKDWSYLVLTDRSSNDNGTSTVSAKEVVTEFRSTLTKCGMGTTDPFKDGLNMSLDLSGSQETIDKQIKDTMAMVAGKSPIKSLLVFLPNGNAFVYARIKFWAEAEYGLHTFCCVKSKLKLQDRKASGERQRTQYFANEAMKINLKLGGINQTLPRKDLGPLKPHETMIVGIDVTHPSPGSLVGAPSIAGVVASIDKQYAQWPASISLQRIPKQEMVSDLKAMFLERLRTWQKYNDNKLPRNIVVYRDGVSDSQYEKVTSEELPQIQDACAAVYPANSPQARLAIIVVTKRHHTRLYPKDPCDADAKGNPRNGTLVDRSITLHKRWDFFLLAHTSLQGTAKPAHYIAIYNQFKEFEDVNALHSMVSY